MPRTATRTTPPRPGSGAPAPAPRRGSPVPPTCLRALLPGLALVGAATVVVLAGSRLVPTVSPLVVALLLGALVAPVLARAASARGGARLRATGPGIAWTSRVVLRAGVVLLGFGLSVPEVLALGWRGLVVVTTTLAVTFAGTLALGRVLRVPRVAALLVATGFSVCGAAAISAMQGVVAGRPRTPAQARADDEALAASLALVTLYGTLAIAVLPALASVLGLGDDRTGLWIGASVQEVAQVVTAAGAVSDPALATATVAKLARVALLAPLVAVAGAVVVRAARRATAGGAYVPVAGRARGTGDATRATGVVTRATGAAPRVAPVPWFVVGFVAAVALRSLGVVPAPLLAALATATTVAFAAAMFALGLGVDVPRLLRTGRRSLALGALSALLVTTTALAGVLLLA